MWLLKLQALRQRKETNRKGSLPVISNVMIVGLPLLLALLWYPKIDALQYEKANLQKTLKQHFGQQTRFQNEELNTQKLAWLDDYPWLTWQLEKEDQDTLFIESNTKEKAQSATLTLQGISGVAQWRGVIDRLLDAGHFQPVSSMVKWQLDGQLRVMLALQRAPVAFESPLIIVPKRIYTPWPDSMKVSTALYWDNAWRASLNLAGDIVYLRQGLWIPELAATLTRMNASSVTFRQQFSSSNQIKPIEKKIYYAFSDQNKGIKSASFDINETVDRGAE